MRDVGLYALTVMIWGTTWIAVTLQAGTIAPEVSVSYRFALAGLLFLGFAGLRQTRLRHSATDHAWMALQGALLAVTFVCIYVATTRLASGLVAVIFSLVAVLNAIGMRLFFRTRLHPRLLFGAALGVVGVWLIFRPRGGDGIGNDEPAIGLSVSLAATLFAALAGMVIVRNQRQGIPLAPLNGYSLLYGAGLAVVFALLLDKPIAVDWSSRYLGSLLYLTLVGSVLVFAAYLELIRRIGAERAGYVAVASPVVALLMSGAFEALRLDEFSYLGLVACLVGNVLVLRGGAHPTITPK